MPVQDISGSVIIDGEAFSILSAELVDDTYNTAGMVTAELFTDINVTEIADAQTLELQLMEHNPFKGSIDEIKSTSEQSIEVVAYNAVIELKNTPIQKTFENATITNVASQVLEEAGVDYSVSIPDTSKANLFNVPEGPDLDSAGERLRAQLEEFGSETDAVQVGEDQDGDVNVTITNLSADKVLDDLAERADAIWYVDRDNMVHFTTTPSSVIHKLGNDGTNVRGILETTAGKASKPYESVQVITDTPVDEDVYSSAQGFITASAYVSAQAGAGEPTYQITTDNIHTEAEAENVANSIYAELQAQQSSGHVVTIGAPEIRPFDVIEMPDHLGGEQYLVSGIEHILNNDEGFETIVYCGGLMDVNDPGNQMWAEYDTPDPGTTSPVGGMTEDTQDQNQAQVRIK